MKENKALNYVSGQPWVLCRRKLKLTLEETADMKTNDGKVQIQEYKIYSEADIDERERINLKDTSKYRFYIKREAFPV